MVVIKGQSAVHWTRPIRTATLQQKYFHWTIQKFALTCYGVGRWLPSYTFQPEWFVYGLERFRKRFLWIPCNKNTRKLSDPSLNKLRCYIHKSTEDDYSTFLIINFVPCTGPMGSIIVALTSVRTETHHNAVAMTKIIFILLLLTNLLSVSDDVPSTDDTPKLTARLKEQLVVPPFYLNHHIDPSPYVDVHE